MRATTSLCFLLALAPASAFLPAADLSAQDAFGGAVAIAGDDIIVVKPGTSRGPATAVVFSRNPAGGWAETARLAPIDPRPGEAFGASVAATADVLLVASADPDVAWGAHVYRRVGGKWTPAGHIPWNGPAARASLGSAPVDLASLMRVAQPAARVVALAPDGSRAAIGGGDSPFGEVRIVLPRSDTDDWQTQATLEAPTASARGRFGAALAMTNDRIVVGAPAAAARGLVHVYDLQSDGSWSMTATIEPPAELAAGASFGAALSLDDERLLVGAPGANVVFAFARANQTWTPDQTLRAPAGSLGFGYDLDVHNSELWIGAPASDSANGAVFRYQRSSPDGQWSSALSFETDARTERAALGTAIVLGDDIAVAGAPQARDGHGVAGVWTRRDRSEWSGPALLEPGPPLEQVTGSEVRCAQGEASRFACENVDLLAFLPIAAIGGAPGEHVSDLWGWTDPETKREYALVTRRAGISIVDVTNPTRPTYLGLIPGNPAGPRDVKVYRDHLFFVGDGAGDHGLLVFDLKRLRTVGDSPTTFTPDAHYKGMASAHNLVMDAESGIAIPVGSSGGGNTCGGGLHMVDVREPLNPVFAGCYTDTEGLISPGRTHDAQCVVYRGPDQRYRDKQICFVANETALRIVDITDKTAPAPISRATYPSRAYIHQGWLTEDQRYFFMNDEVDELVGLTDRTRTLIWDVADLEDPVLAGEYLGPDAATDHNLYIRGNRMYLANYQAGMRVIDISNPLQPVEIGFFDTTPWGGNPPGWFGGAWTAYPFLESGTILVSSINEGLFLLRPRERPVS